MSMPLSAVYTSWSGTYVDMSMSWLAGSTMCASFSNECSDCLRGQLTAGDFGFSALRFGSQAKELRLSEYLHVSF